MMTENRSVPSLNPFTATVISQKWIWKREKLQKPQQRREEEVVRQLLEGRRINVLRWQLRNRKRTNPLLYQMLNTDWTVLRLARTVPGDNNFIFNKFLSDDILSRLLIFSTKTRQSYLFTLSCGIDSKASFLNSILKPCIPVSTKYKNIL